MVDVQRQTLYLDLAVLAVAAAVGSELYFPGATEAGLREERTETVAVAVAELALSYLHYPGRLGRGDHARRLYVLLRWAVRVERRP